MKGIVIGVIIGVAGALIVLGAINAFNESAQVKEQKAGTIQTAIKDGDHPVYKDMMPSDYSAYAEESIRIQALIEEMGVSYLWDAPSGYDMIGCGFLFARYDNVPTMTGEHTLWASVACEQVVDSATGQVVDQPTVRSGRFTDVYWDDEAQLLLGVMQQMEVVIIAFRPGTEEKSGIPYGPSTRRNTGSWRFSKITKDGNTIIGTTPKGIEWILASDMRWTESINLVDKR